MTDDRLPVGFLISAQIRTAAFANIPMVVRKKGHETLGAVFLKINLLDGTSHLLSQVRMGDEVVWSPMSRTDPLPEAEAESLLLKQADIDSDCWLIEVEDREGRSWFPGRIVSLGGN